jgi:hypothetical protein
MIGMFQENGPCEVVELARDKFGTKARDWGWDRSSNIIYVDQVSKSLGGIIPVFGSFSVLTGPIG